MNIDQCHHTCINTVGSYICDCNVGYMLDSDGLTCIGKSARHLNTAHNKLIVAQMLMSVLLTMEDVIRTVTTLLVHTTVPAI